MNNSTTNNSTLEVGPGGFGLDPGHGLCEADLPSGTSDCRRADRQSSHGDAPTWLSTVPKAVCRQVGLPSVTRDQPFVGRAQISGALRAEAVEVNSATCWAVDFRGLGELQHLAGDSVGRVVA